MASERLDWRLRLHGGQYDNPLYDGHVHDAGGDGTTPMGSTQMAAGDYLDYSTYTTGFRNHFDTAYGGRGYDYTQYDPAYRYGYTLAHDERYHNYDTWDEFEATANRGWTQIDYGKDHAWEDFKDAVRHGWESVKDALDMDEDFALFEPGFREHYGTQYTGSGHDYDWYARLSLWL